MEYTSESPSANPRILTRFACEYKSEVILPEASKTLFEDLSENLLYERKANIHGLCIKLYTNSKRVKDAWEDNFYFMSEDVKSHGRVIVFYDDIEKVGPAFMRADIKKTDLVQYVKYDPYVKSAFLRNIGYYGYVKSIALGVAGDIFEDIHDVFSVHGAALDINRSGVSIIAPSGTGKTTHAFGLLQLPKAKLVSDDWYFVELSDEEVFAYSSEKNCYIREDIGNIWPKFQYLAQKVTLDKESRAVADVRWIIGKNHVKDNTVIEKIFLFKRDYNDKRIITEISSNEALELILSWDFANPHLLVKDKRKTEIRKNFFKRYFERAKLYLVNTIKPPNETQEALRAVI